MPIALAALLVFALVSTLAIDRGGGPGDPSKELAAAGCTLRTAPSQGRRHVTSLPEGFRYNTFPPTSGPHDPRPAIWDAYDEPVPKLALVHNLEHGGIVVQYGARVPRRAVRAILDWYRSDPVALVVAPLPSLGDRIALTAWTRLATCRRFDADAFDAFREAYRFHGPERVPRRTLQPGS